MMEEVETRDDKTSKPVLRSHLENVTLNTLIRDLLDLTADQWLALITKDNFEQGMIYDIITVTDMQID